MRLRSFKSKVTPEKIRRLRFSSSAVLSDLVTDLSENFAVKKRKISGKVSDFDEKEERLSYKKMKKRANLSKFNVKESIKSLKTSCNTPNQPVITDFIERKPMQEHGYDYKLFADKVRKITIQNLSPKTLLKSNKGILHTKTKMAFFDDLRDRVVKLKSFKEDDLPFTKAIKLPDIIWQEVDNDVLTDEEQKKSAVKKENNWLSETFQHLKKDKCYISKNLGILKYKKNILKSSWNNDGNKQNNKVNNKKNKKKYSDNEDDSDYIPDESTLMDLEDD